MQSGNLYSMMPGPFFEVPGRLPVDPEFREIARESLPDSWSLKRDGVWTSAFDPANQRSLQGFKIHVSAVPEHAGEILRIVAGTCGGHRINFKFAADRRILLHMNSKVYGRSGSGKFIAIYPPTTERFKTLIEDLYQATRARDLKGQYVLSDRRYRDSAILYYRYGGFRRMYEPTPSGQRQLIIRRPDGTAEPDLRLPYFQLPDWVDDPFGGSRSVVGEGANSHVLAGRFEITEALAFSNNGGVYGGVDRTSGREVVVKEARPHTLRARSRGLSLDAPTMLRREHETLRCLAAVDAVPDSIAHFREWEHSYLVQERFEGVPFGTFWGKNENILGPYIRSPEARQRFVPRFFTIAQALIGILQEVHARGFIIGDLSPRNVLVDPDTLDVRLIDLESAVRADGTDAEFMPFATSWMTGGYGKPDRGTRKVLTKEDDVYAAGMVLLHAVASVPPFLDHVPDALSPILSGLLAAGLPHEVAALVRALAEGDLRSATVLANRAVPKGAATSVTQPVRPT